MEDVADYAQRVIVMNGGQVMYEGDKKESILSQERTRRSRTCCAVLSSSM